MLSSDNNNNNNNNNNNDNNNDLKVYLHRQNLMMEQHGMCWFKVEREEVRCCTCKQRVFASRFGGLEV